MADGRLIVGHIGEVRTREVHSVSRTQMRERKREREIHDCAMSTDYYGKDMRPSNWKIGEKFNNGAYPIDDTLTSSGRAGVRIDCTYRNLIRRESCQKNKNKLRAYAFSRE